MMPTRAQRIEGGLWGLLVGDAVGVPYEFKKPEQIPPRHMIDMIPPPDFPRAHQSIPIGTWSDDGAQALALLDSLLDRGQLDPDDLGRRLIDWFNEGRYAVGGVVFDLGLQTSHAIRNLISGVPADRSGPSEESDNGNGSLMRVLPLGVVAQRRRRRTRLRRLRPVGRNARSPSLQTLLRSQLPLGAAAARRGGRPLGRSGLGAANNPRR